QGLVAELREKLNLHRDLAITGDELRARMVPETLMEWAEEATVLPGVAWRAVAIVLALCAAAGISYYVEGGSKWPLLAVLAAEGALLGSLRKKSKEAIAKIDCNAEGLQLFARILERFKRETFVSARLREIAEELKGGDNRSRIPQDIVDTGQSGDWRSRGGASAAVQRLARVVYWVDAREDLIAKMAELPFLYTLQVALAAEAWKQRFGAKL